MDVALASPGDAVAPTKLHVPARRGALVSRDVLVDRLVAARDARLVLVTGAGASALLARWPDAPAENRAFAWLSLDPEDADPVRFWRCAIAALRTVHAGFGAQAAALLRIGEPALAPAVLPLIAAEAATLERPAVLVLDGFGTLGEAPEVSATLDRLLVRLPPTLTVAVAAEQAPAALEEVARRRGSPTIVAGGAPARARARTPDTPAAAIAAALAAGDHERVATVVAQQWEATLHRGEHATVAGWVGALSAAAADAEPGLWPVRLWAALDAGRPGEAERLLATGEATLPRAIRARGLLLHAFDAFRRGHLATMAQSLDRASAFDPQDGFWHTADAQLRGLEAFWRGHPRVAHRHFARAAGLAEIHDDRIALAYATGYLALVAAEGSDRDGARRRLGRLEDLRDDDPAAGEHAVACAGALAEGRMLELAGACESAVAPLQRALALADRGAGLHERAEPLLRLATVHRACGRADEAADCDARAALLLAGCGDHGRLAGPLAAAAPAGLPRETLSPSELAVLRLLPTGLSQREIGAELFLSVNTVKTHCRNIYIKLHAGSREQAVARARHQGML
ncbi:MAG TPA: LuxR C-terminal-related transcriptional regulator [Baekduia sp.]|uniref:LuxR C-terminal-related transcriptional regulator n=1 Tax=Baekduia sp. TaxID=2600305 RepID=UPI002C260E2D|nr:LuxR C-terminal-related transcriptional regulator [Baekduia sp.]HMJ32951.1 LuxR C-terminal-related transcriptional regulator [Baekduia sp.]